MSRSFFSIRDDHDYPDKDGTELPDLKAVRIEAIRASDGMLPGNKGAPDFWSRHDWTMTVTEEAGSPVLTLRFSGTQHD